MTTDEVDCRLCKHLLCEYDQLQPASAQSLQTLRSFLSVDTKIPASIMLVVLTNCPTEVIKLLLPYAEQPLYTYVNMCIFHNCPIGLQCLVDQGSYLTPSHLSEALETYEERADLIKIMIQFFASIQQVSVCSVVWSKLATSTDRPHHQKYVELVDSMINYNIPLPTDDNVMFQATLHLNSYLVSQMWPFVDERRTTDIKAMLLCLITDDSDEFAMVVKRYIIKSIPSSKFISSVVLDEAKLLIQYNDTYECAQSLVSRYNELCAQEYSLHSWIDYLLIQPLTSWLGNFFGTD